MIALRADAGRTVGLGHVRRSLALADALSPWADCRLLVHGDDRGAALPGSAGVSWLPVAPGIGSAVLAVRALGAEALVIDSYGLSPRELEMARTHVRLLVAVDDTGSFPLPADLVVNSALGLQPPESLNGTAYLLGPRFALLSREFAERPAGRLREKVGRILLILGGSTPAGLVALLAWAARRAVPDVELDIVVGPFGDDGAAVGEALAGLKGFRLHRAPESMRAVMLEADAAVTAGGVSALELAATAIPAVGICLAPNQEPNLTGLAREGALLLAGRAEDPGIAAAVEAALAALAADSRRRHSLGERARQLVDGRGAGRVAGAIRGRLASAAVAAKARPC